MRIRAAVLAIVAAVLSAGTAHAGPPGSALQARHAIRGAVTDENFYFVMADRFENGTAANDHGDLPPGTGEGQSGFDPTRTGFYHGGDLRGLLERIDYIRGLGTTAIWLTPSFKNKAVQPEDNSAGYHGYWITDFTRIDPHLGTNDDLRALVDAAHARGMKVYFDIITNHTADVIGYAEGARLPYVSKDEEPYRDADGNPFDDRDFAGGSDFPALDQFASFPYTPVLEPGEKDLKVPGWLNDPTLYHNRGDTTFTGEDSQYGDFFGLDDLFTEHPQVVRGMLAIYERWISGFGIDGFRIDTMKHVDDEFWRRFAPEVLAYARAHGKRRFFMFGEVFDTSRPYTSHFTTRDRVPAVLDFPFQAAAQGFAAESRPTDALRALFEDDDWYTDADSSVYQLPTFLGNHDMGRIGRFIDVANPGATDAERFARDRLAHELMYFSRGNPVVYYGDEQGFVGDGGDQGARQDMFPSQVSSYNDDDLIATDATTADANFDTRHPLYRRLARLAALTREHRALRDGAHQHRYASAAAGIYAFSRIDRARGREYVVALNNAETEQTAVVPTYGPRRYFHRIYGTAAGWRRADAAGGLRITVPALSAVVYRLSGAIPASPAAPAIELRDPQPSTAARSRIEVRADVDGSSFYEVTFYARHGRAGWERIGTDDTAPYRVFDDVAGERFGTRLRYRAVVLDNAGHSRVSAGVQASVPVPVLRIEGPADGRNVRGAARLSAVADPERATHVVAFERRVEGGVWTPVGEPDDSSPVYTARDDVSDLAPGTAVAYRAILTEPDGTRVISEAVSVRVAAPVRTAVVHYFRPGGDYADWGLHLWGDAVAADVLAGIGWDRPLQRTGVDANRWARYEIALADDTRPVSFILHRPGGDAVPSTREPGGDRSFIPLDAPEIWLRAGDARVYTEAPS